LLEESEPNTQVSSWVSVGNVSWRYAEAQQTLDFLQSLHSRLEKPYATLPSDEDPIGKPAPSRPAPEAYALSLSSIAYAQLLLGDLKACKSSLDECEKLLGEIDSVDMVVNAGYYLVAAEYFKVKADYAPYYKNALLYLACIDEKKELSEQDMRQRAHDLCIAALLGETIYNFGELVRLLPSYRDIADK
jgi:26S proteasome regulatory subunit N9